MIFTSNRITVTLFPVHVPIALFIDGNSELSDFRVETQFLLFPPGGSSSSSSGLGNSLKGLGSMIRETADMMEQGVSTAGQLQTSLGGLVNRRK